MLKFFAAVLILSGMVMGAGMFGIPFSFSKAGFGLGAMELLVLTAAVLAFHLMYGEVVLKTPDRHRLPGYVKIYLGSWVAPVSWFSALLGVSLTLLAYILVGSIFLQNIFSNLWSHPPRIFFAAAMIIAAAFVTRFPLKKEVSINSILTFILVAFVVLMIIFLWPHINTNFVSGFDLKNLFLPYGILLFALSGSAVIPDLIAVLERNSKAASWAITLGTILPAVIYFFFAWAVVGALGGSVSEEAIMGLGRVMGEGVVMLGSGVGFLAVFTSFLALATSFKQLLHFDFGLPYDAGWIAGIIIPSVLYVLGITNFIKVIGLVGAIGVGIDSALILLIHHKLRLGEGRRPSWFSYAGRFLLYAMILVGVIYELYKIFR